MTPLFATNSALLGPQHVTIRKPSRLGIIAYAELLGRGFTSSRQIVS